MNTKNKKGLRWKFFQWFGPPEVQNLVNYIDQVAQEYETHDVAIYPAGEFPFQIRTDDGDVEPLMFPTIQERIAFHTGLTYGVDLMGGQAKALTQEDKDALDAMEELTTHSNNRKYNN